MRIHLSSFHPVPPIIPLPVAIIYIYIYLFIYLSYFLAVEGLGCCVWAFSSCGKRGLLCFGAGASHCGRLLLPSRTGSGACRLSSCGSRALLSCSVAHGILLDQGSNWCSLYGEADSSPLDHQETLGQSLLKSLASSLFSYETEANASLRP